MSVSPTLRYWERRWVAPQKGKAMSNPILQTKRAFLFAVLFVLAFSFTGLAQSYTLTINTLGLGTVSASPSGPYAAGTLVTLTATPNSGWSFSSWSGNVVGYANPAKLIMNGNY